MTTAQERLNGILPSWYELLTQWSLDGSLVAAATEALVLEGSNAKPDAKGQLQSLTSQWSAGNFKSLPQIVLLSNEDISGAQGAYADSTDTIYLNADWLLTATEEQIQKVLTEELGHSLDDQLNLGDTKGDEGELFSAILLGNILTATGFNQLRHESDDISIVVNGEQLAASAAAGQPPVAFFENADSASLDSSIVYDISYSPNSSSGYPLLLGGYFSGTMRLPDGSTVASSSGNADAYLAAINSSGQVLEVLSTSSPGTETIYNLITDQAGGIYFSGTYNGSNIEIGGKTAVYFGSNDIYIAKYLVGGGVSWLATAGGTGNDVSNSFSVLTDGSTVIAGYFTGSWNDFSGNQYTAVGLSYDTDTFVSRLDALGKQIWTMQIAGVGSEREFTAHSCAMSNSSVLVAGSIRTSLTYGLNSSNQRVFSGSTGGGDIHFSKVNALGSIERTTRFAAATSTSAVILGSVTTLSDDSVIASTRVAGSAYFGSSTSLVSAGRYLTKLSSSGAVLWNRLVGIGGGVINDIKTDNSGNIYTLATNGSFSIQKYNSEGILLWESTTFNCYGADNITVNDSGSVYVQGYYNQSLSINGFQDSSNGTAFKSFIAKLNSDGTWANYFSVVDSGTGTPGVITSSTSDVFTEGVTLAAPTVSGDPDGDSGSPAYAYQWYKDGVAIATNGTSSTYVVPSGTGAGIYKVGITYTDNQSFRTTVESATQVVTEVNAGNGTPGSITSSTTGVFTEGVTLTAPTVSGDPDGDSGSPAYAYQWYKDGVAIATNGTSSTYVVPSGTGAGIYKVGITYTDNQSFRTTVESATQVVSAVITGPTTGNDNLTASPIGGLISGLPSTDSTFGRGTKDKLSGSSGVDTFVLGSTQGVFYNDGVTTNAGLSDYGFIAGFSTGVDKIQLAGLASQYLLNTATIADPVTGALVSGVGIYRNDSTGKGTSSTAWDGKDELIGFVGGVTTTSLGSLSGSSFVYVSISSGPLAGGTAVPGTTGSDGTILSPITGTSSNETFSLIGAASNYGTGQLDYAKGNGGNDLFVLGDGQGVFYKDSSTTTAGTTDLLWVKDFNTGDQVQLKGAASNYRLQTSYNLNGASGTGIFLNDGSGSGSSKSAWDTKDELIGFLEGVSTVSLTNTAQFIYVA
jgi:hypothetical protein